MNRNEAKKLAPIIKAFGDGKDVQYHSMDRHWITADEEYNPVFDSTVEWRIKPEPREFWLSKTNYDTSMDRIVLEDRPSDFYDPTAFIHVREVIE